MALILNDYLKNTSTGIGSMLLRQMNTSGTAATNLIYLAVYPTTVAYPNAPTLAAALPAGSRLFTATLGANKFTSNGSSIIVSAANITSPAAAAAGTIGWFAIFWMGSSGSAVQVDGTMVSNSVGLNGTANILTANTLNVTAGAILQLTFTMKIL